MHKPYWIERRCSRRLRRRPDCFRLQLRPSHFKGMDGLLADASVTTSQNSGLIARLRRWWMDSAPRGDFWALALATVFFNFGVSVYFLLYNLVMRYLGVPSAHLGGCFSIAQLVQVGAVLLMPFLLRRTGLIAVIMTAQLATAVAVGLFIRLFEYV